MIDEKRLAEYEKKWALLGWYEFNEMVSTIKALWKVVRAAEGLMSEWDNPVPDLARKGNFRKDLRLALFALKEKP